MAQCPHCKRNIINKKILHCLFCNGDLSAVLKGEVLLEKENDFELEQRKSHKRFMEKAEPPIDGNNFI